MPARDRAAVRLDADAAAVLDLEPGDLDALVDVHAAGVGLAGVAPHDRVVADHGARRVVERALDRIGDVARHVELRAEAPDLVGLDPARVDVHQLVGLGALALHRHGALGVREREVAVLRDQQVEVELLRELLVDLEALAVERDALGRLVVGAQDRRVAARAAGADVVHLEHGDVRDAALRQLVGGREAVRAAADDDDVVGGREVALAPERPELEEPAHAVVPRRCARLWPAWSSRPPTNQATSLVTITSSRSEPQKMRAGTPAKLPWTKPPAAGMRMLESRANSSSRSSPVSAKSA